MAYLGDTLDVGQILTDLELAARHEGFSTEALPLPGRWPQWVFSRKAEHPNPLRVFLSAGMHGDEPAGPPAILKLLQNGTFCQQIEWVIFPMLCPENMAANRREHTDGSDPNREFNDPQSAEIRGQIAWLDGHGGMKFDVSLLLHEDWESPGYYLYEQCPLDLQSLAAPMMEAAEVICGINNAPVIEGLSAKHGLIAFRGREPDIETWPESVYLTRRGARRSYTMETPSCQPLEQRVRCHVAVIEAALETLVSI